MAVALAVAAAAVPFAHAAASGDRSKSHYPQLFGHEMDIDDGYKSGYPQLHAIHTYKATAHAANVDEGYKSGYPEPHAIRTFGAQAPPIRTADRAFHWSDAAIGAGTRSPGHPLRRCRRPRTQPPTRQDRRMKTVNRPDGPT